MMHVCPICAKEFNRTYNFERHRKCCSIRPFPCLHCSATFSRLSGRNEHMFRLHGVARGPRRNVARVAPRQNPRPLRGPLSRLRPNRRPRPPVRLRHAPNPQQPVVPLRRCDDLVAELNAAVAARAVRASSPVASNSTGLTSSIANEPSSSCSIPTEDASPPSPPAPKYSLSMIMGGDAGSRTLFDFTQPMDVLDGSQPPSPFLASVVNPLATSSAFVVAPPWPPASPLVDNRSQVVVDEPVASGSVARCSSVSSLSHPAMQSSQMSAEGQRSATNIPIQAPPSVLISLSAGTTITVTSPNSSAVTDSPNARIIQVQQQNQIVNLNQPGINVGNGFQIQIIEAQGAQQSRAVNSTMNALPGSESQLINASANLSTTVSDASNNSNPNVSVSSIAEIFPQQQPQRQPQPHPNKPPPMVSIPSCGKLTTKRKLYNSDSRNKRDFSRNAMEATRAEDDDPLPSLAGVGTGNELIGDINVMSKTETSLFTEIVKNQPAETGGSFPESGNELRDDQSATIAIHSDDAALDDQHSRVDSRVDQMCDETVIVIDDEDIDETVIEITDSDESDDGDDDISEDYEDSLTEMSMVESSNKAKALEDFEHDDVGDNKRDPDNKPSTDADESEGSEYDNGNEQSKPHKESRRRLDCQKLVKPMEESVNNDAATEIVPSSMETAVPSTSSIVTKKLEDTPEKPRKHPRLGAIENTRFDSVDHFAEHDDNRSKRRCKLEGCKKMTHVFCLKCKVHICFVKGRNCFLNYHKKRNVNENAN